MTLAKEDLLALSRLLEEMLDTPVEQRETWLEGISVTCAHLVPALREMLAYHARIESQDFLATMPKFAATTAEAKDAAAVSEGSIVGPFRLLRRIGRGGMSDVWVAERADGAVKREVAIKLPHASLRGEQFAARFALERDILASLSHPNIARLYDAGIDSAGQPYLAMEFVEGVPVTEFCDTHRLPIRDRLLLFQQILAAVQSAHAQLIIHRDLKPTNILVKASGQVVLLDFGIAKLLVEGDEHGSELTQRGERLMTPSHASPEQVNGQNVGTASDTYSLGVLLCQLLTGSLPYRLKRESRAALEEAIAIEPPLRPSQCLIGVDAAARRSTAPRKLIAILAGDLDNIVLKALSKQPSDRYATVDALHQDLERYLAGLPILARPPSRWYSARKFIARHKMAVGFTVMAGVAVLAAAGIAVREAEVASQQRDQALRVAERDEAVSDFLDMLISDSAASAQPITVSDMLARSEALAESEFSSDPEDRAAVLDVLGTHYHTTGDDVRGERILRRAEDLARGSTDEVLTARVTCDHAITLAATGHSREASTALNRVIADERTDDRQAAECLQYLAYMAQDASDVANALKYSQEAYRRLSLLPHPRTSLEGSFLGSLGYSEYLNGRNAAADRYYRLALEKFRQAGREHSSNAVAVQNNWAIVSDGSGNSRRALELYEKTLHILAEEAPGEPPPAYLLGNRARALSNLGRYPEAVAGYSSCLRLAHGAVQVYCLCGLAFVRRELGDLDGARSAIQEAAAAAGDVPSGSPAVLALSILRGEIAASSGHFADAREALGAAIQGHETTASAITALTERAKVNYLDDNLEQAESDAKQALRLAQSQQGNEPYSNRTGLAWLVLAEVLQKSGRPQDARGALKEAIAHLENTVDAVHPALQRARQLQVSMGL